MSLARGDSQPESIYREPAESPRPRVAPAPATTLVDAMVSTGQVARPETLGRLDQFLKAGTVGEGLECWFGTLEGLDQQRILLRLGRDVAWIDHLLNDQINGILHHEAFQRLEAAWRGLNYLVECADREGESRIKIKVLNATWKEVERDFERAIEFDQSHLFRTVYEAEFGSPGGEPLGLLVGDYQIWPRPSPDHPHDDLAVLKAIAGVAAAAFCPFVAGIHPAMFGLDDFSGLEYGFDLAKAFDQPDFLKWRSLREMEDARFVGLTLPQVLLRLPYAEESQRVDRFRFREDVEGPDRSKYLWGNAAFAFGEVVIRAFAETGWLAGIRGVERGIEGGGLVTGLPVHYFCTDKAGVIPKCSTDLIVSDELEKPLADLGFMPLCHCYDTEYSAFYSNQSIQKPRKYDRPQATRNARVSAMLQYMLCVSRFAHYLKVIARDKVGSFAESREFERELQSWLSRYVTPDEHASPEVKSRFPLREGTVEIRPHPGKPGAYHCIMRMWPHFELDELTASVHLATDLAPRRAD